ncbi:MAG: DNA replication and repair protein RecF [Candidatus Syntrophoarchaeum sp. GoM_oil]|nr:MAG: DNA replication and repair protein RecF [Candidatus Syntrophoarchaeum sp. GoM_oil]
MFEMFKEIHISNFKPFRELRIPLTKINLLIGPNNSGKTSVFEAIMLMKELFVRDHPPNTREIYLSDVPTTFFEDGRIDFTKVAHKKDFERGIKLGCTEVLDGKEVTKTFGFSSRGGSCEVKIGKKTISIEYDGEKFVVKKDDFGLENVLSYSTLHIDSKPSLKELEEEMIMPQLQKVFLIHSKRLMRKSYYPVPVKQIAPEEAEIKNAFDILYFIRYRTGYESVVKLINNHLNEYGFDDVRTLPAEDKQYEVVVKDAHLNIDINISKIGSGINQLLPMLILLNYYPDKSLVLIELPEIHMHPKMQSEFADLLVHIIEKKRHQMIIETHSEHIIYGLLNMVAKKELEPSDIGISYFRKNDGEAERKELEITEKGTIKGGLPDFFEANLDDLLEWVSAISEE